MEILAVALIAFFITLISIPLTIKFANALGLVDDPTKRPHPAHVHKRIIPRAGGLPIYLGILVTSLFFLPIQKYLVGIFLGITILLIIGLLDDKLTKFNPYIRLILLFVATASVVGAGIGITFINNPFSGIAFLPSSWHSPLIFLDRFSIPFEFLGPHKIIIIADILAFFWIVILTQVINWSKGVDGQMPGITTIAALTLGFTSLRLYGLGDTNQLHVAQLSFIVAGASLGFLVFNWHPAKIFPGFSGSTILAFMLAVLAILSGAKLATALLVLAVPTIDFVYTIFRRISQGKSPVWGDRGHLHHRLLDLGWTHPQISLFYILGSAMLGSVALFVDTSSKIFAILAVVIVFVGFTLWLNSFGGLSRQRGPGSG